MKKEREIRNTSGQENRQGDESNYNTGLRNKNQAKDTRGEAQNVNDDAGRPLTDEESEKARNKAGEGLRQGRNKT